MKRHNTVSIPTICLMEAPLPIKILPWIRPRLLTQITSHDKPGELTRKRKRGHGLNGSHVVPIERPLPCSLRTRLLLSSEGGLLDLPLRARIRTRFPFKYQPSKGS